MIRNHALAKLNFPAQPLRLSGRLQQIIVKMTSKSRFYFAKSLSKPEPNPAKNAFQHDLSTIQQKKNFQQKKQNKSKKIFQQKIQQNCLKSAKMISVHREPKPNEEDVNIPRVVLKIQSQMYASATFISPGGCNLHK